jgi:hypothetical protein
MLMHPVALGARQGLTYFEEVLEVQDSHFDKLTGGECFCGTGACRGKEDRSTKEAS